MTLKFLGSVMHYPKDAFAKDHKKPVITPVLNETSVLGNRKAFSTVRRRHCYRSEKRDIFLILNISFLTYSLIWRS